MREKTDYVHVKKTIAGFEITLYASSFFTAHVQARKKLVGRQGAWSLNQLYELKQGRWTPVKFKDRWVIRYKPRYPTSARDDHDSGTRHHPDSKKVAETLRRIVSSILNKKKAARWRIEGVWRKKDRKDRLERYFEAAKSFDRAQEFKRRARITYEKALALDKAYTPRQP